MELYQHASNARFNKEKTQTLSLTGSPQPLWNSILQEHSFPPCHDRTHPQPVIYLGYPLATTSTQLQNFMDNLLNNIKHHCNIHLQCNLSIRRRATVINTLILSKL